MRLIPLLALCSAAAAMEGQFDLDLGVRHLNANEWSATADQFAYGLTLLLSPVEPLGGMVRVVGSSGSGSENIGSGVTEKDDAQLWEADLGVGLYGHLCKRATAWLMAGVAIVEADVTVRLSSGGASSADKFSDVGVGPAVVGGIGCAVGDEYTVGVEASWSRVTLSDTLTIAGAPFALDTNTAGWIAAAYVGRRF